MEQAYKHTDVFLAHTWQTDLEGRENHSPVRIIDEHLNRLGYSTWFDEKPETGDSKEKMAEGVDYTKCVLVFVTEEYMKKINSKEDNNCKFEFDRALAHKTDKKILCLVMDAKFSNPDNWFGKLKETLGGCLYVSLTGNLMDEQYLKKQLQLVVEQLKQKGVTPSQTKNKCENCMIKCKDGSQHEYFTRGDYCTFCSNMLLKTVLPKNYCVKCNTHADGSHCSLCKVQLLDKNKQILELKEQYIKVISVDCDINLKYNPAVFAEKIESLKEELLNFQCKRDEAQASNLNMVIDDTKYKNDTEGLWKSIDVMIQNTPNLTAMKDEFSHPLEPTYKYELHQLKDALHSLQGKRRELDQRTGVLSGAMEELEQLGQQLTEFMDASLKGNRYTHDESCQCDRCMFEREFTYEMINNRSQKYLKSLIMENEIEKIKLALELWKEIIIDLVDDDGFNLLISLTAEYGTLEMLNLLLEVGVDVTTLYTPDGSLLHRITRVDMMEVLCHKYGEVLLRVKNQNELTPFTKAYHNNNIPLMEVIRPFVEATEEEINNYIVQQLEAEGLNYIEKLIDDDNITTMTVLLTLRAEIITMKNTSNRTPFLYCSEYGSLDMLKLLEEHGSDVNQCDSYGYSALMSAVRSNTTQWSKSVVEYLCNNHPQLIAVEKKDGWSVFHCSAITNKVNMAPILLNHCPSPQLLLKKKRHGETAIDVAKRTGNEGIVKMYEDYVKKHDSNAMLKH